MLTRAVPDRIAAMAEEKERGRNRYTRVFALALAVYTAALLAIAIPRIPGVMEKYRIREHAAMYLAKDHADPASFTVVLSSSSSFTETERTIERQGRDDLHLAAETLLMPIGSDELQEGLVSYIPEGTELIGIAEKEGFIFIDLSSEMRGADRRAFEQIERTLRINEGPCKIHFLIEGRPVSV